MTLVRSRTPTLAVLLLACAALVLSTIPAEALKTYCWRCERVFMYGTFCARFEVAEFGDCITVANQCMPWGECPNNITITR